MNIRWGWGSGSGDVKKRIVVFLEMLTCVLLSCNRDGHFSREPLDQRWQLASVNLRLLDQPHRPGEEKRLSRTRLELEEMHPPCPPSPNFKKTKISKRTFQGSA